MVTPKFITKSRDDVGTSYASDIVIHDSVPISIRHITEEKNIYWFWNFFSTKMSFFVHKIAKLLFIIRV